MAQLPTNVPPPGRSLAQIVANLGAPSQVAKQSKVDAKSLAAGIAPSFAVVSIRGREFHVRRGGNEKPVPPVIGQDPVTGAVTAKPLLRIVIVKASTAISKTFYLAGYNDKTSRARPDCFSIDGVKPDAGLPTLANPALGGKQHPTCPDCPWNKFGSSKVEGRHGKACQDNKRLAIVPYPDIRNEVDGGPMLLRLPPSAFSGLAELQAQLHQAGYEYYSIIMEVTFEAAEYPLVVFTPVGVLNEHEMTEILALQEGTQVARILGEQEGEVPLGPGEQSAPQTPGSTPQGGAGAQNPAPQQAMATTAPPQSNGAEPSKPAPPPAATVTPTQPMHNVVVNPPVAAETIEQQIARLQAELAAKNAPPPPETPEQTIARLQAELAAKAAPAPAVEAPAEKPKRGRGRPRAQVVTPAGNGTPAAPVAAAPTSSAEEDEADGDMPPDLDARIDQLLKPGS